MNSTIPAPVPPATSTSLELYPYQQEALAAISQSIKEGDHRPLLALATGGGKTVIFSRYIQECNKPGLILAHRDELISQAIAKLRLVWPDADVGRVQGQHNEVGHQITVASVQSLSRDHRFNQAFPHQAALDLIRTIVTDEAHHSTAASYQGIYNRFGLLSHDTGGRIHLGVTATPARSDKLDLGSTFDRIAYSWSIRDGIGQGYLANLTGFSLQFDNDDIANVPTRKGEFVPGQLERAVKKVARDQAIVEAWLEQSRLEDGTYRRTIVFAVTVEHAHELAEAFATAGIRAAMVHGEQDLEERQSIIRQFHQGQLDVLTNCEVLTEGFDCPPVSCIVMARPCRSKGLYLQMVGRGTRTSPGKSDCLILDVCDVSRHHSIDAAVTLGEALGFGKGYQLKDAAREITEVECHNNPQLFVRQEVNGGSVFDPLGNSQGVNFIWHTGSDGMFILSLPKDERTGQSQWLAVYCRPDLLWDIYHIRGYNGSPGHFERLVNRYSLPDSTSATHTAEELALKMFPNFARMAGRDATWRERTENASEKQIALLLKYYPASQVQRWLSNGNLTKHLASVFIGAALAKNVRVEHPRSSDNGRAA